MELLIFYLDADCDLEKAGIEDINEMEMEGSDSNINLIVQIYRIPGFDDSEGDWTGAKRYYIIKDYYSNRIGSTAIQDLGEVNMGSVSTLQSFIQWKKSNYPADNYNQENRIIMKKIIIITAITITIIITIGLLPIKLLDPCFIM